jgi:two-component system chemotaxis sensor kinase CheA
VSDVQFDLELMIAQNKAAVANAATAAVPSAAVSPATAGPGAAAPASRTPTTTASAGPHEETSAPASSHWHIDFRPYPELFARGNDPLRMLRELATLGDLEVHADLDSLPSFESLEPQSCYLAWRLDLRAEVAEAAIRQVFEWAEGDCDLQIARALPADAPAHPVAASPAPAVAAVAASVPSGTATAAITAAAPHVAAAAVAQPRALVSTETAAAPAHNAAPAKDESKVELPLPTAPDSGSIRVSVEKIDELMNTVGELVITQSMLSQLGLGIEGPVAEKLRAGLAQLERNMRELQESVMRVRMLPINTVFSRFPRMVRDLAQRLGKQIELKMTGEQTELDKTVLEKIGDPLVHLIRNSIDHGIESPAARASAGKPPAGTVHLDACHRGGNIAVEVSDDGGGLDKDRILAKARDRGLAGPDDVLSDEQVYDLIFMPGFSTADKTTDVSGRGVGMDVVRRNVKELGGKIELRSQRGKGSKCIITLPLTLAIVDGQSVAVGSETYIVPLVSIVESMQLKASSISRLSGQGEVFSFRGFYLPIVRLYEVFGVEPHTRVLDEGLVVVAEGEGHQRIGLFVDDLLGQQQVVIKSLETNYGHIEGVSGATILGDGSVALILDIPGLIRALTVRAAA